MELDLKALHQIAAAAVALGEHAYDAALQYLHAGLLLLATGAMHSNDLLPILVINYSREKNVGLHGSSSQPAQKQQAGIAHTVALRHMGKQVLALLRAYKPAARVTSRACCRNTTGKSCRLL